MGPAGEPLGPGIALGRSSRDRLDAPPEELLEQSSTMAKKVPHAFADKTAQIMGCYYEFARRYPIPGKPGQLFQGFIPKSADKIFESTFERK